MPPAESAGPGSVADLAELGKLLEEHRPRLVVMVRRRIDPALAARLDAEGIVSEGFLRARRKWQWFKEQAQQPSPLPPYVWLYGIVRDCLIEAWHHETRRGADGRLDQPWPDDPSVQLGLSLVCHGTTPEAAAVRAEMREQMRQTLARLRPADREILWLRYYDELSFAEAALVLGITENAATVRCVRALKKLRALWLALHPHERAEP